MAKEKEEHDNSPERPFECGECKKNIAVIYTEIVRDSIVRTCMCADCPELRRHLQIVPGSESETYSSGMELECGNCGTKLEEIKRGHRLGCTDCYTVFGDLIFFELHLNGHLPMRVAAGKKTSLLHIGRAPGESLTLSPSSRLLALNEALKDTLSREDYEQAAWLRDQIQALTENSKQKEQPKDSKNETAE